MAVELPLWENRAEEAQKIMVQTEEDMHEKGKASLVFVGNVDAPEEGVEWGDDYEEEIVKICDGEL